MLRVDRPTRATIILLFAARFEEARIQEALRIYRKQGHRTARLYDITAFSGARKTAKARPIAKRLSRQV